MAVDLRATGAIVDVVVLAAAAVAAPPAARCVVDGDADVDFDEQMASKL